MMDLSEAKVAARQIFLDDDFESVPVQQILDILKLADDQYFNDDGESFLEDSQYDALKRFAHSVDATNPYFLGVGSSIRGGKVPLPFKMGSLVQVYEGEAQKWVRQYKLQTRQVCISDKLDGASALIVYDNKGDLQISYSRGDGIEGADTTRHIRQIASVPQNVGQKMAVRAEVIMRDRDFEIVKTKVTSRGGKPYKNARNMTTGLMNATENKPIVYQYLEVVAYEVLEPAGLSKRQQFDLLHQKGFETALNFHTDGNWLTDERLTDYLKQRKHWSEFALDGLVIEVVDADLRASINPSTETLDPEYARKYKIADAPSVATVKHIEWNISKDGYAKPRVHVNPIEVQGVTIQHATGFNAQFIYSNCIGPGAKLNIVRSGDVIPFITNVIQGMVEDEEQYAEWFVAEVNKLGNWEWTDTEVDIVITDTDNKVAKFEQLKAFIDSIEVPHLREGNLQKIFDAGFETPEDVITLTQQDISAILSSGVNGKKIFDGLKECLTNIPWYKLAGSHHCFGRGVGIRKMKKLYFHFKGDVSKIYDMYSIMMCEGFERKTAIKVVSGAVHFQQFLDKVEKFVKIAPYEAPKSGSFSGQKVVFTGFRDSTLEKMIIDQGGAMATSVSKNTTLVVASDPNSTSGKASKAKELGIKVISPEQLSSMLGE